jgi:ubiquinol-cytochrome c reductase cytochrome b subunit
MHGPSTYLPKTGFERWLDSRLPIVRFAHDTIITFPTPRNLNIWYTFGGILAVILVVQIVTGVVLAMHYVANADLAWNSVERIMRDVNYGWMIRYIHANGASLMFLAVYIHIFRGLYYGSYKAPREILWILGVVIYLLMMATAFLGYTLPWGQMSFWGATVITNFFTSFDSILPGFGTAITEWLWGGFAVGDATLNRFFSLHYLLPFVIAGVVVLHIWALHVPGNNNPLGIDVKGPQDTVPFHPYYTVKDAFYLSLFLILFAVIVFYAPNILGDPENYTPANPMVTPAHIKPEWYYLPFYAILRAFPDKLLGVIALFGSIGTLFFVPWLDTSPVRSAKFRPVYRQFFWILVADCILLGYIGRQPAEAVWQFGDVELPLVWLGRLGTAYFFAHFWVIMPLVGWYEKPRPLPDSIAKRVLATTPP